MINNFNDIIEIMFVMKKCEKLTRNMHAKYSGVVEPNVLLDDALHFTCRHIFPLPPERVARAVLEEQVARLVHK